MKKNLKKFDWLILILIILVQIGLIVFLAKRIIMTNSLLRETNQRLISFEKRDESLLRLEEDYDLIKEDVGIISQILPGKEGVVGFINEIENEASQSGLVADISFGTKSVTSEDSYKVIRFSLIFEATYYQMIDFVKKLEEMSQVIVIEKVTIQSPEGIEGKNMITLNLKAYIDPNF
ncbi:hypothetical protein COT75_04105 [Candidatus Beckwithbacteria bacterium CG10_big_fil_rev_8_21_14_0_10_34_10]|uniref:Type 4a pilus biogenesis protein PilO n=1 Tax=Candidatus Beckwithbacteria bacterium CG10_big_fil_rev_8_21_14_0_10_34_10 TaxID=1974495 RepID=A0A2H0W8N0_9BACT|nr:MAG: hypothetical protein COT75_04105 [Candidatus Beckwithbacteria bacterium CG10_big_fil_rev_8_21_14_0_10_34_10]